MKEFLRCDVFGEGFLRRVFSQAVIHLYARPLLARNSVVRFAGMTLNIPPGVFHPGLFLSSKILASYVSCLDLRDKYLLDMGTGSGIIGLSAAKRGATVLAVDISPKAVDCAIRNVRGNGLGGRMTVQTGDLLKGISSDQFFDYIVWNPPFYPRDPVNESELAWNAGNDYAVIHRFAVDAGQHLKPGGSIVLILSSDIDTTCVLSFFRPLRATLKESRRKFFEIFSIYELSR